MSLLHMFLVYAAASNEKIGEAVIEHIADELAGNPKERGEIMATVLELWLEKGIKIGIEKGIEKGMEKGRKEGVEDGMKKGMEKERFMSIKKMHGKGYTTEQIADLFELTPTQIEKIIAKPLQQ